jgi:hypothetical protein
MSNSQEYVVFRFLCAYLFWIRKIHNLVSFIFNDEEPSKALPQSGKIHNLISLDVNKIVKRSQPWI